MRKVFKKMKKAIASFLCLAMVASLANGIVFVSQMEEVKANYYSGGYYNCTYTAWELAKKYTGIELPHWSDAVYWYNQAKEAGYAVGTSPQANSIIVYSGGNTYYNGHYCGHVGFVSSVNGNSITVMDGGWNDGKIHTNTENSSGKSQRYKWNKLTIVGYIYLKPKSYNPEGHLDSVEAGKGTVRVSGWTFDRDNLSSALQIHVYVGGIYAGAGIANRARADVNSAYSGVGNYHGFDFSIPVNVNGNKKIDVFAINIGGGSTNTCLGSRTVNIQPKITYKMNTNVATKILNRDATISGAISDNGRANSWGFYLGTSPDNMEKYTVSTATTSSSFLSTKVSPYVTLRYGTTYYYKMWATVGNQTATDASPKSFTTTAVKPEKPEIRVANGSDEIGIEDSATVNWNDVENAEFYHAYLYDEDGNMVHKSSRITGTKYTFPIMETDGIYKAYVESYSDVGSKGKASGVSITVHPDVTVTFKDAASFVDVDDDYEPAIISEQTVHWGKSALKPTNPTHTGYTFKKWSNEFINVKENLTITAEYDINSYTVKYVNSLTNEQIDSEEVEYYSKATKADTIQYDIATGFVRKGYNGWDKDYQCITEDTVLYTCVGWYNENFPIYTEVVSADREYDAAESDNEGYTIIVKMTSQDITASTKGRLVVALKTKEGKLLTSTESAAFLIKKQLEKQIEVFVPYNKAATQVEVYVVGQYKEAVPISNSALKEINQDNIYTDWSTEKPEGDNVIDLQKRTEYRYKDKQITTSYNTSLDGYTQSGSQWIQSGSGKIDYVPSFPSGFNRSHWIYSSYNKSPVSAYENTTTKRTISTSTIGYVYFHWCRGYTGGPSNRYISDCYESPYTNFHAFTTSSPIGYNSSAGAFSSSQSGVCKDSYYWNSTYAWTSAQTIIKRCTYTDYKKLFTYYKWSDFSDWSTTQYNNSNTREVETREVYRYKSSELLSEDNSGQERTIKGTLGSDFAGKEATLFIYKIDEASDYTNEYVAQTKLDEQGNYEFTFKLREEPTVDTGDYTIMLGVENTSTPIYLDRIEAPKNTYTVKFYDYEGNVISEQKVIEGENAEVPSEEKTNRKGYTFKKWSETNVNVTSNLDIYPEYEINTYNVVFVDWNNNSVSVQKFEYGSPLVTPLAEEPDEGTFVRWEILSGIEEDDDTMVNESTVVTNDLVVGTKNITKTYDIKIKDYNGNIIKTETVEYGKAIDLQNVQDDLCKDESKQFFGWQDTYEGEEVGLENNIVTGNMIICPAYTYADDVVTPKAGVSTGVYDKEQTITLSCDTADASIYYTTDGTDPSSVDAVLYTEPFTISQSTELKFYATCMGMNSSEVVTEYYSINLANNTSKWLRYSDLPEDVINNTSEYNLEQETGYSFKVTKTATTIAEKTALEDAGWVYAGENTDSFTAYSEWSDFAPDNSSEYIGMDVDTKPVYDSVQKYKYSYYKYTEDDKVYYSPTEVEGKECTYKEIILDNKLLTSGFEKDKAYFVYDGATWYNQTKIVEQSQVGNQYRYRLKINTYNKWSDYTTDIPDSDETREYKTDDVYRYTIAHKYLITYVNAEGEKAYELIEEGGVINPYSLDNSESGYIMQGIYLDEKYTNEVDYGTEVTGDMTLYVKEDLINLNVTFAYDDDTLIESQTVAYGHVATPPEVEQREGYRFVGWDTEEYKNVTESVYAVAKYVAEEDYATVELDNANISLYIGKSMDLKAMITPITYDGGVTWSSSDPNVATVSENGKVIAFSSGVTTVTVKVNETGETDTCTVVVKSDLSTDLSLLKNSKLSLNDGYLRRVKAGSNTVKEICNDFENLNLVMTDAEGVQLSDDELVGTGAMLYLMKDGKVMDTAEVVVLADITGDGNVNNMDVSMLVRCLLDKELPTNSQILASDVNGDGKVNNRDAALIARSLVGKEKL